MKRLTKSIIALICIIPLTITCFAASAEQIDGQRQYFYSTSAQDTYNFAHLYLNGANIQIVRRGYQEPGKPDEVGIRLNGTSVFSQSLEWEGEPVDGSYYGYTVELDTEGLDDGEYILSLESSALGLVEDASGETTRFRTTYTLASVSLVKQGAECYFPVENRISSRYNNNLLQQLQQGNVPDDFTVLKEHYAKQENGHTLLDIEAKAKELTVGLNTDLEKCLAIEQWITQNIAYDFDFPRENTDIWLKAHPEDAVRLDDALNAFDRGYAQCYGYAKLTTLMLGYVGVDSVYIRGRKQNDVSNTLNTTEMSNNYSSAWNTRVPESWSYRASDGTEMLDAWNHAWNAVKISGSWYFLDTCQGAADGYHRTNSEDLNTAYTQLNRCYSGVHVFPSLSQISNTHMAIRYGADKLGTKLKDV